MTRLHDMDAQKIKKMDNIRKGNNEQWNIRKQHLIICLVQKMVKDKKNVNQNAFGMLRE